MTQSKTKAPAKKAKPAAKKVAAKKESPAPAAATKTDRTYHTTAAQAAQAAKDTPKSAVLKASAGFYTGSKRAGVKSGAQFVGRVAAVLGAPRKIA